jgi:methyl-accepting chemotaxis protein
LSLTEELKKGVKELSELGATYHQDGAKVFALAKQAKYTEAQELLRSASKKSFDALDAKIIDLQKHAEKDAIAEALHGEKLSRTAIVTIVGLLAGSILLGIVLATWITAKVCGPIQRLVGDADQVAQGNLSIAIESSARDEVGLLAKAFSTMVDNLRSIIGQVKETSVQVASAANQLHANAGQMATGAEEVASQTGTVATASEEMAATSSEIAQNCHMAADASEHANASAEQGAQVVQQTVTVMNGIAERVRTTAQSVESLGTRSDQIGAIIGTIEDIADQTNLLALNAAIEAARAGEQGRGFAVVADEVRALAERTTKATREIGEMIKAIQSETRGAVSAMEEGVRQVEEGTNEAAKSGEALNNILSQIGAVSQQVAQIATAAEEQTATSSEISTNIQQITKVVQETSRGAQESAAAANQLALLSDGLQRLVGQFRL